MTASEVAAILEARKIRAGEWVALCPSHDDRRPSLSITAGDDGRTLICCRAGCENSDVVKAAGLTFADLYTKPLSKTGAKRFTERSNAPRKPKNADPGRAIRDEVFARNKVITYGERLLQADPDDERGWDALAIAYHGMAEAEYRLDRLEGRRT